MPRLTPAIFGLAMLVVSSSAALAGPLTARMTFTVDTVADFKQQAIAPGTFDTLQGDLKALTKSGSASPELLANTASRQGNSLLSVISGNRNDLIAKQIGSAELATLVVNGNRNSLTLLQAGAGNAAAVAQKGNFNSTVVIQRQR